MKSVIAMLCLAVAGTAAAEANPADVICQHQGDWLPEYGPATLTGDLQCRVVANATDVAAPAGARAVFWIEEAGRDASPPQDAALAVDGDDLSADLTLGLGRDFKACRDFTIKAQIVDGDVVLAAGEHAVTTRCRKPKAVKAKLSCTATTDDGTTFRWPGNGVRVRPRLGVGLTCTVTPPAKLPGWRGGDLEFSLAVAGHGQVTTSITRNMDSWIGDLFLEPGRWFDECESFTIAAQLYDGRGATIWSGRQKIQQRCGD